MDTEKPKKKKRSKEDLTTSSVKPKKKKRLKEDSTTSSAKPKKKKRSKEDLPRPKKKGKKKARPKDPAEQKALIKKVAIGILMIVVVIVGIEKMQQSNKDKATSKGYALALSALDKMQLRCTVLWSEVGIDKACTQALGEMAIGKLKRNVDLTVIESRSHRFTAQAKSKGSSKIFEVNKKGKLFLKVNGCLAEVHALNPTVDMIEKLEKKCNPPAT